MCQVSRPKDSPKKRYSKSTNMCSCKLSLLPTLPPSQGLKTFFVGMKFLEWNQIYVDYMCGKFQGQKIYQKKDIQNLLTCVVKKKTFTTTNFGTLPKIEKKKFGHKIFVMRSSLYW